LVSFELFGYGLDDASAADGLHGGEGAENEGVAGAGDKGVAESDLDEGFLAGGEAIGLHEVDGGERFGSAGVELDAGGVF